MTAQIIPMVRPDKPKKPPSKYAKPASADDLLKEFVQILKVRDQHKKHVQFTFWTDRVKKLYITA